MLPALASACVALDDNAGLGAVTPPDHIGGDLAAIVEDTMDGVQLPESGLDQPYAEWVQRIYDETAINLSTNHRDRDYAVESHTKLIRGQ